MVSLVHRMHIETHLDWLCKPVGCPVSAMWVLEEVTFDTAQGK